MNLKECYKCGARKPLEDFYKHPKMSDGHVNKCKQCNKKDVRTNRKSKLNYYQEYDRIRGNRQGYEYTKEYRKRYPNKYKAHCILNNALRDNRIEKGFECEICFETKSLVAHHDDYLKPLSVKWLCQSCHVKWHKKNGEGKNA